MTCRNGHSVWSSLIVCKRGYCGDGNEITVVKWEALGSCRACRSAPHYRGETVTTGSSAALGVRQIPGAQSLPHAQEFTSGWRRGKEKGNKKSRLPPAPTPRSLPPQPCLPARACASPAGGFVLLSASRVSLPVSAQKGCCFVLDTLSPSLGPGASPQL